MVVQNIFHVKINGNDSNKEKGFGVLRASGTSITCLPDEEYIVNAEALLKLKRESIDYQSVEDSEVVCCNGSVLNDVTTEN